MQRNNYLKNLLFKEIEAITLKTSCNNKNPSINANGGNNSKGQPEGTTLKSYGHEFIKEKVLEHVFGILRLLHQ